MGAAAKTLAKDERANSTRIVVTVAIPIVVRCPNNQLPGIRADRRTGAKLVKVIERDVDIASAHIARADRALFQSPSKTGIGKAKQMHGTRIGITQVIKPSVVRCTHRQQGAVATEGQ